jgi:hypothetical protein
MAANQVALSGKVLEQLKPEFAGLGLSLDTFVVENLSLPDELQKVRDQRIGMNMVGDMRRYTQFEVAQAIPIAAANEGGGEGDSRRCLSRFAPPCRALLRTVNKDFRNNWASRPTLIVMQQSIDE